MFSAEARSTDNLITEGETFAFLSQKPSI